MINKQILDARGHWGVKYGLENQQKLLEALGSPQNSFKTILIAGTNGKGSTGAFISHALNACRINVGWTTSPHLVSPTERVWINGHNLKPVDFNRILGKVFEAEEQIGIQATYFELITTAAFLAFHEAKVTIAVVEVGMGGRWDATNVSDPILTVLTNVGIDHVAYLGNTREEIAREKLCTARSERPLVIGPDLNSKWLHNLLECNPTILQTQKMQAETIAWDHSFIQGHRIQLAGEHQIDNLATAWRSLLALKQYGIDVDINMAWNGIENTTWPGRMWKVPGLCNVFMDGAHNLDGAQRLASHARNTGTKPHLFFSAMGDKDLDGMKAQLITMQPVDITLVHGENPRYASQDTLKKLWGTNLEVFDISKVAKMLTKPSEHCRLICGSLYFLGDLLAALDINPVF